MPQGLWHNGYSIKREELNMKNQKGTIGGVLFLAFVVIWVVGSWVGNFVKFVNCDFALEPSVKCEVIHGIGIVPVLSLITVWFDIDD